MFILQFLRFFGLILLNMMPVIGLLVGIILLLAIGFKRGEGWSYGLAVYCAFITATTVGYGVVHPTKPKTRFLAICISLVGLILTGLLVALAVESIRFAANYTGVFQRLQQRIVLG